MNTTKNYSVKLVEDYSSNLGDPIIEKYNFETYEDALKYYEKELTLECENHGTNVCVELWEDGNDEPLMECYKTSALLPVGSVVVTYQHHRHMNYSYDIIGVRDVRDGERYEDLSVSIDRTSTNWDVVFECKEELIDFYNTKFCAPFNRINSGSRVIEEFINNTNL
jgi:hypothetical protein